MKNSSFSKLAVSMVVCTSVAVTAGCSKTLSEGITNAGHVDASNIVFPNLDDAWQKNGQFPNLENLSKIKPGVTKDELYYLLDRPHFSEAQYAREWDYILKFYQEDNTVRICQYKVIFDDEYKGQEFYWLPTDCIKYAKQNVQATPQPIEQTVVIPQATAPSSNPVLRREKITLDADALFRFDKSDLHNMLPSGHAKLDELANQLRAYGLEGDVRIALTGHTDYKGSEEYNYGLSKRRANTVLAYLVQRGINPVSMSATGVGEDFPVKQCPINLSHQQEIDCLQPNRRVDVDVVIYQFAD